MFPNHELQGEEVNKSHFPFPLPNTPKVNSLISLLNKTRSQKLHLKNLKNNLKEIKAQLDEKIATNLGAVDSPESRKWDLIERRIKSQLPFDLYFPPFDDIPNNVVNNSTSDELSYSNPSTVGGIKYVELSKFYYSSNYNVWKNNEIDLLVLLVLSELKLWCDEPNTDKLFELIEKDQAEVNEYSWLKITSLLGRAKYECEECWEFVKRKIRKRGADDWTADLDKLKQLTKQNGRAIDWIGVSAELKKSPLVCFKKFKELQHAESSPSKIKPVWKLDTESKLISLQRYLGDNYNLISFYLGGSFKFRDVSVKHSRLSNHTGSWSDHEDFLLISAVAGLTKGESSKFKWTDVASIVGTRSDVQCRDRFVKNFSKNKDDEQEKDDS